MQKCNMRPTIRRDSVLSRLWMGRAFKTVVLQSERTWFQSNGLLLRKPTGQRAFTWQKG
jgi:hypothetical protein